VPDIAESLQRKLGPLKVWQWAVIGGSGVWLWRYFRPATSTSSRIQAVDPASAGVTYQTLSGAGVAPASFPPPYDAPYGANVTPNLYLNIPYGSGSAILEGSETAVSGALTSLLAQPVYQPAPTYTPPPEPIYVYVPAPTPAPLPYPVPAPTPVPPPSSGGCYDSYRADGQRGAQYISSAECQQFLYVWGAGAYCVPATCF
jgi:hypothetical protein